MIHFYYATFHIYKRGEMNTRPLTEGGYIEASSMAEAYRKAQQICKNRKLSGPSDTVICRHKDIRCESIKIAQNDIKNGTPVFEP